MPFKRNIVYISIQSLKSVLFEKEIVRYRALNYFLVFSVLLDALSLLLLLPILNIITSHENIRLHRVWGKVFNYFSFTEQEHFLLMMVFLVFLTFLIKNLVSIWIGKKMASFAHNQAGRISQTNFNYYIKKDFLFFKNHERADLITQIMFVPSAYASGVLLPLATFISESILLLILVVGIAFFKPLLFFIKVFNLKKN
ncbi:MAG: hypothetical protein HYZ42_03105 [Bacteroidetes bacterium]|nr:hypothetical protein [Bacteroidota bacterium]